MLTKFKRLMPIVNYVGRLSSPSPMHYGSAPMPWTFVRVHRLLTSSKIALSGVPWMLLMKSGFPIRTRLVSFSLYHGDVGTHGTTSLFIELSQTHQELSLKPLILSRNFRNAMDHSSIPNIHPGSTWKPLSWDLGRSNSIEASSKNREEGGIGRDSNGNTFFSVVTQLEGFHGPEQEETLACDFVQRQAWE